MQMAVAQQFIYDVFISYNSNDTTWAESLYNDLLSKGLRVFLDRERITAGSIWNNELSKSLDKSRHLVVLWSNAAKESNWVQSELATFNVRIGTGGEQPAQNRRIIFVLLEGDNSAYPDIQKIMGLKQAGVYNAGANAVSNALWRDVVNRVEEAVNDNDTRERVGLAILATTRARLDQLDPTQPPALGAPLHDLLQEIGLNTIETMKGYYGLTRTAWRPFGGTESIQEILDRFRDDINQSANRYLAFRWQPIGDDFWSNNVQAIDAEIRKLKSGWAVVVIDPLSLYDPQVAARLQRLYDLFTNEKTIVVVTTPLPIPPPYLSLRNLDLDQAKMVYQYYYQPGENTGYATFSVNVDDHLEIKRLLLSAFVKSSKAAQTTAFLQT
jgi:hypothetical protein